MKRALPGIIWIGQRYTWYSHLFIAHTKTREQNTDVTPKRFIESRTSYRTWIKSDQTLKIHLCILNNVCNVLWESTSVLVGRSWTLTWRPTTQTLEHLWFPFYSLWGDSFWFQTTPSFLPCRILIESELCLTPIVLTLSLPHPSGNHTDILKEGLILVVVLNHLSHHWSRDPLETTKSLSLCCFKWGQNRTKPHAAHLFVAASV